MSIKCVECEKGPCRDKTIGVLCNGLAGPPDDDWPDEDDEDIDGSNDMRHQDWARSVYEECDREDAERAGNPRSVLTDKGAVMIGGKQKQRPAPTGGMGGR